MQVYNAAMSYCAEEDDTSKKLLQLCCFAQKYKFFALITEDLKIRLIIYWIDNHNHQ